MKFMDDSSITFLLSVSGLGEFGLCVTNKPSQYVHDFASRNVLLVLLCPKGNMAELEQVHSVREGYRFCNEQGNFHTVDRVKT